MSIKQNIDMECSECGNTEKVEVWSSINVQINPEAKEELLKGKINLFNCSKCGFEALVPMELLYHDMKNKYCVWLSPFHMVEDKGFLDRFTDQAILDISPGLPATNMMADYFRNVHLVLSMDELVRYVIFRDSLAKHKAGN